MEQSILSVYTHRTFSYVNKKKCVKAPKEAVVPIGKPWPPNTTKVIKTAFISLRASTPSAMK